MKSPALFVSARGAFLLSKIFIICRQNFEQVYLSCFSDTISMPYNIVMENKKTQVYIWNFCKKIKNKLFSADIIQNIKKLFYFLRVSKVNLWFLVLSIFLSFCFTLFTMYSVSLLLPLTKGIIGGDFGDVQKMAGIGHLVKYFHVFFNSPTRVFVALIIWVYLMTIIKNILSYLAFLSTQYQAKLATTKLRQLLVAKCVSFGKKFYDDNTISYIQSILTKSTGLIESQFKLFQQFIIQFLLLVVYLIVMVKISFLLTLIAIIIFPVVGFFTKILTRKITVATLAYSKTSMNLNDKIFNMLYCMPVIKSFVKEQHELDKFNKASEEEVGQSFKIQKLANLAGPVEDIGTTTGILFVAFGLATIMKVGYAIDASQAIVFFYLAMKIIPGLNALNDFKLGAAVNVASIQDVEHIIKQDDSSTVKGGEKIYNGLKKEIAFSNLSFSYTKSGSPALRGVSFSVEKGKTVAIVGPTGSGKSTLVNLLLRFYDCPSGSILLDGNDIRDYDVASVRKHMSYVSQDVLLFNDTIKNNLIYGSNVEVTDSFLTDIGKKTQIHNFIDKMPQKYDTIIGERGGRLSGGEKQRLSIARAIIKNPEILILDEATSALDSQTESRISDFISENSKGKTLIIIAHRLSTIRKADKIVYLENGNVTESGTLQELVDKKGAFYRQWETQKI